MTKKELVAKLKELGLKGNVQESKKVLEERLKEATVEKVEPEYKMEYEVKIYDVEDKEFESKIVSTETNIKRYIGRHPITGEELYK